MLGMYIMSSFPTISQNICITILGTASQMETGEQPAHEHWKESSTVSEDSCRGTPTLPSSEEERGCQTQKNTCSVNNVSGDLGTRDSQNDEGPRCKHYAIV